MSNNNLHSKHIGRLSHISCDANVMHTHGHDGPFFLLNVLSDNTSWFSTVNKSSALNPCSTLTVHGKDKKLLRKLSDMPPTPRFLSGTLHKRNLNDLMFF